MISELVKQDLEELQTEYDGFKITDLESATWCFRKLRALEEQQREYDNIATKEIERINTWYRNEKDKLDNQKAFFNGLLSEYALNERRNNPKFKLSTPYGKLGFRKQQPKWNYDDEKLINELKFLDMNQFIRTKEEVNKAELKKQTEIYNGKVCIKETGEFIPSIEIIEQEEKINIEVM